MSEDCYLFFIAPVAQCTLSQLLPLWTGLPLTLPCAVRVQFWYTPSQTVDSVDKKPKFTGLHRRAITIYTDWMKNTVSVDQVVAGSTPVRHPCK